MRPYGERSRFEQAVKGEVPPGRRRTRSAAAPDAAGRNAGDHHAVGAPLRGPPRRRSRHRPPEAPSPDPRHGRSSGDPDRGGDQAPALDLAHPLPRVPGNSQLEWRAPDGEDRPGHARRSRAAASGPACRSRSCCARPASSRAPPGSSPRAPTPAATSAASPWRRRWTTSWSPTARTARPCARRTATRCGSSFPAGRATSTSSGCAASRWWTEPYLTRMDGVGQPDLMPDGKARQLHVRHGGEVGDHLSLGRPAAAGSGVLRDQGPGVVGSRAGPPGRGLDGRWEDLAGRSPPGARPPLAHTRFRLDWRWDGREAVLQSRCTDETGYVQPTLAELVRVRGLNSRLLQQRHPELEGGGRRERAQCPRLGARGRRDRRASRDRGQPSGRPRRQLPTYGVGRPPDRRGGQGLGSHHPARRPGLAAGQRDGRARQGDLRERCAACHGERGEDPKYNRLVGGQRHAQARTSPS